MDHKAVLVSRRVLFGISRIMEEVMKKKKPMRARRLTTLQMIQGVRR